MKVCLQPVMAISVAAALPNYAILLREAKINSKSNVISTVFDEQLFKNSWNDHRNAIERILTHIPGTKCHKQLVVLPSIRFETNCDHSKNSATSTK